MGLSRALQLGTSDGKATGKSPTTPRLQRIGSLKSWFRPIRSSVPCFASRITACPSTPFRLYGVIVSATTGLTIKSKITVLSSYQLALRTIPSDMTIKIIEVASYTFTIELATLHNSDKRKNLSIFVFSLLLERSSRRLFTLVLFLRRFE